jgi:hypothetical protein
MYVWMKTTSVELLTMLIVAVFAFLTAATGARIVASRLCVGESIYFAPDTFL